MLQPTLAEISAKIKVAGTDTKPKPKSVEELLKNPDFYLDEDAHK